MKFFFLAISCLSLSVLLSGCNTTREINRTDARITQTQLNIQKERDSQIDRAAGAVYISKELIDENKEAAKEVLVFASEALLPAPSLSTKKEWDSILESIKKNPENTSQILSSQYTRLTQSKDNQETLSSELEVLRDRLVDLHRIRAEEEREKRLQIENMQEFVKILVYVFSGAAVISVIAGVILLRIWGALGISLIVAGGGFGLSAYYVTQSWFAYISGGVAAMVVISMVVAYWARRKPEKTLRKVVKTIEEESDENPDVAKTIKNRLSKNMNDDEKKFIKEERSKIIKKKS